MSGVASAFVMDLNGQLAVVTGGGSGIGLEIATALARAGSTVALVSRERARLTAAVKRIQADGGNALAMVADVTAETQVQKMAASLAAEFEGVDLLINNAGILGETGRWWEKPAKNWWRVMEVNLKGAMLCVQALLPGMLTRGRGRIINMGSNAGAAPIPGLCPYAVSKAALLRLTDSLREDLLGSGVRTFAVSPGLVKTGLSRKLPTYEQIPESGWRSAVEVSDLCLAIAAGLLDELSGRYLHAGDDIGALIKSAKRIVAEDLHALRLCLGS